MALAHSQQNRSGVSQEYLLLDSLRRAQRSRQGLIAVHIHLSRLREYNRKEHHIRIAAATFESVVQNFEGQAFTLDNGDLFFVCRNASVPEVDAAIMKVRHLFSVDPLAQGDNEEDIQRFATWYNLEVQFDEVVEMVDHMHREVDRRGKAEGAGAGRRKIGPKQLVELERFLSKADLSRLLRRQPICAMPRPHMPPTPMFREYYISIADLQSSVLPKIDVTGEMWLFQHLTQTLDQRMLTLLNRELVRSDTQSFSINLNIATVLSPSFVNFDAGLKEVTRGTVVIELQNIDIFNNMGSFLFARDFLRERGYRICLDGVNYQTLEFIDREQLGIDLIKMTWSSALVDDLSPRRQAELKQQVEEAGRTRIIISRVDSRAAIDFGNELGITMYQGRFIDGLLAQAQAKKKAQ